MSNEKTRAACADCGKTFSVPDASKSYVCKACGGRVTVARAVGPTQPLGEAPRSEDRREANAELQGALRSVRWLRVIYALGAVLYGGLSALLLASMARMPERSGALASFVGFGIALTILCAVGFRQVRMQPFAWAVAIAAVATASLVLQFALGDLSPLSLGLRGGFVTLLWSMVVPAVGVRRHIEAHPDLYVAHSLHGTRPGRHEAPERALERFEEARRRTARGSVVWALGIALALGGALAWTWMKHRGAALSERMQAFAAAWDARDTQALASLYPPEHRDSAARSIARVVERRVWGESWPTLLDATQLGGGDAGTTVTFRVEGDALVTRWRYEGNLGWCLTSLDLPD